MPTDGRSRHAVGALSLVLATMSLLSSSLGASPLEVNIVAGYGKVGAHQYDQGVPYGAIAVNVTGFHVTDSLCLGGLGFAFRGGDGIEAGLGIPLATYHYTFLVAQVGVGIQRYNFQKNFYYLGVGVSIRSKRTLPASDAASQEQHPDDRDEAAGPVDHRH